jgi:hypothetical protein
VLETTRAVRLYIYSCNTAAEALDSFFLITEDEEGFIFVTEPDAAFRVNTKLNAAWSSEMMRDSRQAITYIRYTDNKKKNPKGCRLQTRQSRSIHIAREKPGLHMQSMAKNHIKSARSSSGLLINAII